ncbi:MAG: DedA family protein [Alphaproteobacteria bacterium]|nr:DedA family protein [Alphaproteobacteria bacterium]
MDTLLRYGLLAVFLALILTPFGLPLPEDISLLVAGILAGTGHASLPAALAIGYLGVLTGDVITWTIGRRVGVQPKGFISRLVGRAQIERIERFYRRYGAMTIAIARQIPGMRYPAFFFAGATGISLPRFLFIDALAAIVTTNVFVWLGFAFADDAATLVPWLDGFRLVALLVVGTAVVVMGVRIVRRWRTPLGPTPAEE